CHRSLSNRGLHSFPTRRSSDLWWLRWTCSCEPPSVIEDVADDEEEPAGDAQDHRHHLAGGVVFRILRVLPEEPEYDTARKMVTRSEEHTSELQSRGHLVCRLLL